ncbi:large with possible RING domain [Cryptosporidium bovis]|uniref:large with possible RING domain n=1 Tax=Cryptosporidium bovis TaxID=310047 RepID=UPI00351A75F1|nr:large with possible RING domain [Cryptosporidium bovis]
MSATLGSVLFPGRQKTVVDSRKGVHNKRKKQVSSLKSQEQTAKQFTTRLLLDDETIGPNDFLTPFPTDDIRNTEQFWEYMERVFYPIDERWVEILDLTARPRNIVPDETCIGLHFSYRWALVDLFDVDELFKLIGNKDKIFGIQNNVQSHVTTRRRVSSTSDKGGDNEKNKDASNLTSHPNNEDNQTSLFESKVLDYLKYLDLPLLELIGVNQTGDTTETVKKGPCNPYFEEWKYLYQRLCFIEGEIDSMIKILTKTVSDNIKKDNSRKLLQRHQKKRCKEFLVRSLHFHSVKQFMDSLEEVLYFDSSSNSYLTTWDDGEAVRAAWISQDQLLQLLLFRQNTTESKYSISIPSEYIPYAKSLKTPLLNYLISSGIQLVSIDFEEPRNIDTSKSETYFDEDKKVIVPEKGCIKLTRHPLCHYCRRSCSKLSYSRCPSKLKPSNIGFLTASGNSQNGNSGFSGMNSNDFCQNRQQAHNNSQSTPIVSGNSHTTVSSSSAMNVYFSRSLVPWKLSRIVQENDENINHSSLSNSFSPHIHSNKSYHHTLTLNCSQICNVCSGFEKNNSKSPSPSSPSLENVIISRAYSPNNCWRMYCSECIMHNFSSVIKQKHSNGVVLRYYCPFCSGSCNCERCLRNQQIRKIKNYLKSRFSGHVFHCAISSLLVDREIAWHDFLLQFGCNLIGNNISNSKYDNKDKTYSCNTKYENNTTPVNEHGEVNESLVTINNIANVSYINNYSIRMSVSENTHLGFIWLQANNIPFQKPSTDSTGVDHNPKTDIEGAACQSFGSISGASEIIKNIPKSKLRRSSLTGLNKNKKVSTGQTNVASTYKCGVNGFGGSKMQEGIQSLNQNGITYHSYPGIPSHNGRSTSVFTSGAHIGNPRSGAQNIPPSVHIPKEVLSEPTHASGTSVLWSLRSILNNNVNRYHKECLNNLEKWEEIRELYKKKRNELEEYFGELHSKLGAMDDWIRSISFTETNKRYIMRKLPLLCWAVGIPSAKSFNFDDYPQLTPGDNIINLVHILKTFVENGILSEDLPKHPLLSYDSNAEMDESCLNEESASSVPQKTVPLPPTAEDSSKQSFSDSLSSPTSVMEYIFKTIPEVQNVVVNLVSNTSKDEFGKTQKAQRNTKKDKNSANLVGNNQAKAVNQAFGTDQGQLQSQLKKQVSNGQCSNAISGLDGSLGSLNPNNFVSESFCGIQGLNLSPEGPARMGNLLSPNLVESKLTIPPFSDINYSSNKTTDNVGNSETNISVQGSGSLEARTQTGIGCQLGTGVSVAGGALGFGGGISENRITSIEDSSSTYSMKNSEIGINIINSIGNQVSVSNNSLQISKREDSIYNIASKNGNVGVDGSSEKKLISPGIHISQCYENENFEFPVNKEESQTDKKKRSPCSTKSGFAITSQNENIQGSNTEFEVDFGSKMGLCIETELELGDELNMGIDHSTIDKKHDLILKRKREKEGPRRIIKRNNASIEGLQSSGVDSEICENETEDSSNF